MILKEGILYGFHNYQQSTENPVLAGLREVHISFP